MKARRAENRSAIEARKRQGPPADPNFFKTIRISAAGAFDNPYGQHGWTNAGIDSIATPLSQAPFRIYQEQGRKPGEARKGPSFDDRLARVRSTLPDLPRDKAEEVATSAIPRERAAALRRVRPAVRAFEVVRAVGDVELVESGPWYDLFKKPNTSQTRAQLWQASFVQLCQIGECFWVLLGATDKAKVDEIPREVWPVPGGSEWDYDKDTKTKAPRLWKFGSKPELFELFQVVFAHYYNPKNIFRGLAKIAPVAVDIEADHRMSLYNLNYIKNGAIPSGVFTSERPMDKKQAEEWLKGYEERHAGEKKAGRPPLLTGGVKFEAQSATHAEMQYIAGRAAQRDTVLSAAFRVTKNMVGLSGDQNRASMLASIKGHYDSVVLPNAAYMEDLLASDLFTEPRARTNGADVFGLFDFSSVSALQEDFTEKLRAAEALSVLGYTANQINEFLELGLPVLTWGDVWWRDQGKVPVFDKPDPEDFKPKPQPPQLGPGKDPEDEPDEEVDDEEEEEEEGKGLARRARRRGMSADDKALHWEGLIERLFVPGEERFGRQLKRFLGKLKREQIERIRKAGKVAGQAAPSTTLFDLQEWKGIIASDLRPIYRRIVAEAAEEAEAEVAKAKKTAVRAEEGSINALAGDLSRRVGRVVGSVRRQLEQLVEEAQEADEDELVDLVSEYFGHLVASKGSKLGQVSRTETSAAVNQSREMVFLENSIEEQEWITADDELVRDNHVTYGGAGPVPLKYNFATLAGESYTLMFPHDPQAPPGETVNCRCVVVPVV